MLTRSAGNVPTNRPMYSFPELRVAEILQCMEDLRIPLGEAELNKPSTATVQRLFEAFADIFMGVGKEQLGQQQALSVAEGLEHPDLQLESIGLVAFYRLIVRLMVEVGIEDFSLRDLIRPEAPRLRLILSAIINFAKFREEQLAVCEELSRRVDESIEQRVRLAKRQEDLSSKLSLLRAKRADEEPAAARLKEEISKMIQTLRDLKREQGTLSSHLDTLKGQRGDLGEKLAQSQFLLSNVKQECNKLKSRIVHSPEKLLQIIAEMSAGITNERNNLAQLERKSRELQIKLDALTVLEQELQRTLQTMELLSNDLQKRDELTAKVREERDSIDRQQIAAKDLAIRDAQLARQTSAAQDKLNRLHETQAERRTRVAARLKALQEEYGLVSEERARVMAKMEQGESMIKDFELRMAELRRSHEAEVVAIRTDCVSLKARVLAYVGEVRKSLNSNGGIRP